MYGSGFNKLLNVWKDRIGIREAINLSLKYGIRLPSKPHAYLLKRLVRLGIEPRECSDETRRCPTCGSCLDNGFCRFCGTYVSEEGDRTSL